MRRLATFALMISLIAGMSMTATGSAVAAPPETLAISVSRPADTWSSSGAFVDSGSFVDDISAFTRSLTLHGFRTFMGSAGTFTARVDVRIVPTATPGIFDVTGSWTVVSGTGAYAGLRAGGSVSETFDAVAGTVVGTWEGSVFST